MRSIPQALMWETYSHGRWWILVDYMGDLGDDVCWLAVLC
jgi:hypothetical protein